VNEVPRPGPAVPGPAARLEANQDGLTLFPLGTTIGWGRSVRVLDADGRGVGGVTVTFSAADGKSTLQDSIARTDASGYAIPGEWRLSRTLGLHELIASVTGLDTVRLQVESIDPPATLDNTQYVLRAVAGVEVPVLNARPPTRATLVSATLRLDRGNFVAIYSLTGGGVEWEERHEGAYRLNGASIVLGALRVFGTASADGRLQLVSDDDNWPLYGVREEFVRQK
jgi:hypothetical protein